MKAWDKQQKEVNDLLSFVISGGKSYFNNSYISIYPVWNGEQLEQWSDDFVESFLSVFGLTSWEPGE